jgi:hypothetical protein
LEIYQVNELARNSRAMKSDNLRCNTLVIFVYVPCITVIAVSCSDIISAAHVTTVNEYCLAYCHSVLRSLPQKGDVMWRICI